MFNAIESLVLLVLAQNDNKSLSVIRMIRIFRIVRVFNKLKSLQKVILDVAADEQHCHRLWHHQLYLRHPCS